MEAEIRVSARCGHQLKGARELILGRTAAWPPSERRVKAAISTVKDFYCPSFRLSY